MLKFPAVERRSHGGYMTFCLSRSSSGANSGGRRSQRALQWKRERLECKDESERRILLPVADNHTVNGDIILFEQNLPRLDSHSLHHFFKCEMVVLFSVDHTRSFHFVCLSLLPNTELKCARLTRLCHMHSSATFE